MPETLSQRLKTARRCLARGKTLRQAAQAAHMTAAQLDKALWRFLGR